MMIFELCDGQIIVLLSRHVRPRACYSCSYMSACDFLANSSKCDGNMVVTPLRNTVRVFRIRCPFDGTKKMTEIQHF